MMASATRPMPATAQKVARQPRCWPMKVPSGTPRMVATVSPANITAMAEALRSAATRRVATTDPTPKNVPCAKAVKTRAAMRTP